MWTYTLIKKGLVKLHNFTFSSTSSISLSVQWRIQKFRKGDSATGARSAPENVGCHAHFRHVNVRSEYLEAQMLEATPGLVNRLEISKELIREYVTVPGCCCIPLLYNHLMDSCSYLRKNTLLAAKGGWICTPLPPLNPPLPCIVRILIHCVQDHLDLAVHTAFS